MRRSLGAMFAAVASGCVASHADLPERLESRDESGTITIDGAERWSNMHVRIDGDLVITPSGSLVLEDSTVEILGDAARDHQITIAGELISNNSTLGGTTSDAGPIQTVVNLSGRWVATATTVQYSYGILARSGTLEARELTPGPFPDSVLMSGSASVRLVDSTFAISVFSDASGGGSGTLSLGTGHPVDHVFDRTTVPGARYRLELVRTTVPQWFLFVSGVAFDGPSTHLVIKDAPNLIPAILAHDYAGAITLPASWRREGHLGTWSGPLPRGTKAVAGNLTLELGSEMSIPGWGIYLSGGKTDAVIQGPTAIAELFVQQGARASVQGTPGSYDTLVQCTTTDVTDGASLMVTDAMLGWFADGEVRGQLRAERGGTIVTRRVHAADLAIIQDGNSFVSVEDLSGPGRITILDRRPAFVRSAVVDHLATSLRNDASMWVGAELEIGSAPLYVNRLGRAHLGGDRSHEIKLIRAVDGQLLATATAELAGARDQFAYGFTQATLTLEPGQRYFVVSREVAGGDAWGDFASSVTTRPELTVIGPVWSTDLSTFTTASGGTSYGPVGLQFWDQRF